MGVHFAMQDLGPLHYFLGVEATMSESGLFLSQTKYIVDLLRRVHMDGAKPILTPCTMGQKLSQHTDEPLPDPYEYRSIVGALQYVTVTHPDISFAVSQVSQFLQQSTMDHLIAVKRILRYLKATLHHALCIQCGPTTNHVAFSDADWAGCPDDRRSTSGYCIYYAGNLISWSVKKQPTVSRSSAESEYRGLANTSAELT
ncbi:hypothetical protein Dimus_038611 [Dionaea muscipula]